MKTHVHMSGWMHMHKPDWHLLGIRADHLFHNPSFWAVLVLAVLICLMILMSIFAASGSNGTMGRPPYPFYPYAP